MEDVWQCAYGIGPGARQDVLWGVYNFCNHSDCGGGWDYASSCEIVKALDAILGEADSEGVSYIDDEYDRERIVQMRDVFESIDKDGKVEIV